MPWAEDRPRYDRRQTIVPNGGVCHRRRIRQHAGSASPGSRGGWHGERLGHGCEGCSHGYPSVTPRIVVSDVGAQVDFLRAVFDATGEVEPGRPADIRIGDSLIMVSPAGERDSFPAFLHVYVANADESYQRALTAGATTLESPVYTPYGDRRAMVRDPLGNVIQIAHQI